MSINTFSINHESSTPLKEITDVTAASQCSTLATAGSCDFEAVMARLNPATRAAVVEKIQTVDPTRLDELIRALKTGELSIPIFSNPDLMLYSHAALFNGEITSLQFATLQRFSMALECRGGGDAEYQVHHLFDERGEPNLAILEMLRETWSERWVSDKIAEGLRIEQRLGGTDEKAIEQTIKWQTNQCNLSEEQEETFLALVRELPASERQVILMEDAGPKSSDAYLPFMDSRMQWQTVSQVINYRLGINAFCRVNHEDTLRRMIASTGIMQAYLTASGRTVRINPVVGLSDRADIHTGLVEGFHDMALAGIPGIVEPLPKKADGYIALGEDFPWHDFYHCIRQGQIPADHMKMHLSVADALLSEIRKREATASISCDSGVERLYEAIIDAEYPLYSSGVEETIDLTRGTSANLLFWGTLQQTIRKSIIASTEGNRDLVGQNAREFAEGVACELISKAIVENKEEWAANGVTLEGFFRITDEVQKQVDVNFEEIKGEIRMEYLPIDIPDEEFLDLKAGMEWGTGILPVAEKLRNLLA